MGGNAQVEGLVFSIRQMKFRLKLLPEKEGQG